MKAKKSLVGLCSGLLLFAASCGNAQNQEGLITRNVQAEEFKVKMEELDNKQILDVRTPKEWEMGVIPGAKKIDFYGGNFEDKLDVLDKDRPVMVYCAAGSRSSKAMEILKEKGFKEVYNLSVGFSGWKAKGYDYSR